MSEELILSLVAFALWMGGGGIAYCLGYRDGYKARKLAEYRRMYNGNTNAS